MFESINFLSDLNISIFHDSKLVYPEEIPFNSSIQYPEYPKLGISKDYNSIYDAIRTTLVLLGLDKENIGTPKWNPLGEIIQPGDKVVIKPNFVLSSHKKGGDLYSVITHPSIIRPLVDYTYIALKGTGRIIIADAPQMDCNFIELLEKTRLGSIKEIYKKELNFDIDIFDLRNFWLDASYDFKGSGSRDRHKLPGDPLGNTIINLGKESQFYGLDNQKYYGADYNRNETQKHHKGKLQEYSISKTILSADVVISLPKLKVHKKVGVTLNLKGFVGISTNKNYLVHYKLGSPDEKGDQYPDGALSPRRRRVIKLQRKTHDIFLSKLNPFTDFLYGLLESSAKIVLIPLLVDKVTNIDAGDWFGNDSAWRMVADLTKILIYADKEGTIQETPVRRLFCLVDGIIGGENQGPLIPDNKKCGLIVAGFNPLAVDLTCTRLMGFDYKKIKMLSRLLDNSDQFFVSLSKINIHSNENLVDLLNFENKNKYFNFVPPFGWRGYIEIE